jgi:hypothetical protein
MVLTKMKPLGEVVARAIPETEAAKKQGIDGISLI